MIIINKVTLKKTFNIKSLIECINNFPSTVITKDIYVILTLLIITLPLIITTFNTGWFSDDFQMFCLNQTKNDISNITQLFKNILEPRGDYHLIPVHNLINYLLIKINSSSQWVHLFVISTFILSGFIIYKIICLTHISKIYALFCSIIFIINYDLAIKSLVFHCLHYNTTNTFTGLIAFYYTIRYLSLNKIKYLFLILIFLLFSIFNYESGLIFLPIIGIYLLYSLIRTKIELYKLINVFIILFLATSIYAGYGYYYTKQLFPIFTLRANSSVNNNFIDKQIKLRNPKVYYGLEEEDVNAQVDNNKPTIEDLTFSELRNTYAPRSIKTVLIKSVDFSVRLLNYTFIEKLIKKSFNKDEKIKIKEIAKKWYVLFSPIIIVFGLFLFYYAIKNINNATIPFLIMLVLSVLIFIIIFNRIDIANAITIFSSIVIADFIFKLFESKKIIYGIIKTKYLGYVLSGFIFFGPFFNIITEFEYIYPFDKNLMFSTEKIYDKLNEEIGHYTDNTLLFIHKESMLAATSIGYQIPTPLVDLSHYNLRAYQKQFIETDLAIKYADKSMSEFQSAPEIHSNIRGMIIDSYNQAKFNYLKYSNMNVLFVDSLNNVYDMKVLIDND